MDALVGPDVNQGQEPIHRNSGRTRELRNSIFHGPASTPLPGDGGYALLQEGVAWNLTYELACGFEVEFVQWRPQQMWLGFFLVPGHRRDETDPATWRAASRADPEPIGVELLTRMLAGAPAHLDWAPP